MRRVVSLFLPSWPTDALRRRGPGAPALGEPLVTARREGGAGSRRVIAAADEAARALGLRPGMAVAHGRALVPGLTVAEADPASDADDLTRLAAWCLRYAPLAAPDPPDGIWIDVTGSAHLAGGEAALLDDLLARLRRARIAARAAIAGTPGAAHAVARFCGAAPSAVVPPGGGAAALAGLPVAALRLPPETIDALRRLGFERIGSLAAVPRAPLRLRFGPAVGRRLDQALGRAPEPIAFVAAPGVPRRQIAFAEPVGDPEALRRAVLLLAAALARDLEAVGLGARRLDLVLRCADRRTEAVRVGTARPSRDPAHLGRLLARRLEALAPGDSDDGPGVEVIELAATLTEALPPWQPGIVGLTGGSEAAPAASLAMLVDALAARLGPGRLFRAEPVESDLPERSVRRVPPLAPASGAGWPAALPQPGRLLSLPEPVEVTALLPNHPPALFVWRGRPYRVRRADGPERVYGEWWRGPDEVAAVRDYFRVEAEDGARFWLFRDGDPAARSGSGAAHRWYLHGLFG